MNSVQLAVSVRRLGEYDPAAFCAFVEHWAASNSGQVQVSVVRRHVESGEGEGSELLFLKVDYDNYPTTGNYFIEIQQFVRSAASLFDGIECVGISAA